MRKIRNNVFMILAIMPLLTYLLIVVRGGSAPEFLSVVSGAFGVFGDFFVPIISPLFTEFVSLADSAGVGMFAWCIGYYVTLLLVYLVFSLFTCLITIFMEKIDGIKGGRK